VLDYGAIGDVFVGGDFGFAGCGLINEGLKDVVLEGESQWGGVLSRRAVVV